MARITSLSIDVRGDNHLDYDQDTVAEKTYG